MSCGELEILLCDYVDGTLDAGQRSEVERHMEQCAACREIARDAAAAVGFLKTAAAKVEPPPQLITQILFDLSSGLAKSKPRRGGIRAHLGRLLEPVLQPRFAMGMAMTILSFSMLGRFAGINVRQLQASDLNPVKVWEAVDDRVHRTWDEAVKFYESLRLVYEVRSRLRELMAEAETESESQELAVPAEEPEASRAPGSEPPGERGP